MATAATLLAGELDLERLLGQVCQGAAHAAQATGCAVHLVQDVTLTLAACWNLDDGKADAERRLSLAESTLRSGAMRQADEGDGMTLVAVPLRAGDAVMGVVTVSVAASSARCGVSLQLLQWVCDIAGPAVRGARIHTDIARIARVDYLTGCLNRTALQEGLRAEIECTRREETALSVIMVDLNDFKDINETHGHAGGDRALQAAGMALQTAVRPGDAVGRYGGDEFCVILPRTGEHQAGGVACRAMAGVEAAMTELGLTRGRHAAVAGVAEWAGDAPSELVARADRALMYAKRDKHTARCINWSDVPAEFMPDTERRTAPEPLEAKTFTVDIGINRMRQRSRQLLIVAALANRLAGLREEAAVVRTVASEIYHSLGYLHCCIARIIDDDGAWERIAATGRGFDGTADLALFRRREGGIQGRTMREGRTQVVADVLEDPDFSTLDPDPPRSDLCVPVYVGAAVWGVINLEERRRDAFDDHDVQVMETIAAHMGATLALVAREPTPA